MPFLALSSDLQERLYIKNNSGECSGDQIRNTVREKGLFTHTHPKPDLDQKHCGGGGSTPIDNIENIIPEAVATLWA